MLPVKPAKYSKVDITSTSGTPTVHDLVHKHILGKMDYSVYKVKRTRCLSFPFWVQVTSEDDWRTLKLHKGDMYKVKVTCDNMKNIYNYQPLSPL